MKKLGNGADGKQNVVSTHLYGTFSSGTGTGRQGLQVDTELNDKSGWYTPSASRAYLLTDDQEEAMVSHIDEVKAEGVGGWDIFDNCADFVIDLIYAANGVNIDPWWINTPDNLADRIDELSQPPSTNEPKPDEKKDKSR